MIFCRQRYNALIQVRPASLGCHYLPFHTQFYLRLNNSTGKYLRQKLRIFCEPQKLYLRTNVISRARFMMRQYTTSLLILQLYLASLKSYFYCALTVFICVKATSNQNHFAFGSVCLCTEWSQVAIISISQRDSRTKQKDDPSIPSITDFWQSKASVLAIQQPSTHLDIFIRQFEMTTAQTFIPDPDRRSQTNGLLTFFFSK